MTDPAPAPAPAPAPPPLTADELLAQADLAGRARVVSVKMASDGTHRIAKLRFESLTKGKIPSRFPFLRKITGQRAIKVRMRIKRRDAKGRPLSGEWSDGYRPGDFVITHLTWNAEAGVYMTLSWNAVWLVPH